MLKQQLRGLVFPEGILLLAATALVYWGAGYAPAATFVRAYPPVVLVAGLMLAWRFRRGRLVLALLGLALADQAMLWLAPLDADLPYAGPAIVRSVAILLPAALAVLAFSDERGLLTNVGLRRLGLVVALAMTVVGVWFYSGAYPDETARAFDVAIFPPAAFAWLPLGQPADLVALAAIVVLVGRTLWRPSAESRGFLWAAVASVIAVSVGPADGRATLHLANGGLVLVVAAMESAYAMAYHDGLTGLPTRRAFDEALMSVDGTYTIAMVDVDYFKKFNDTHGHDVGDQVLRMVAGRLERIGGGGRAFRYGGEEFAVLYARKTTDDAAPHLEALRATVEHAVFTLRGPGRPKRKPRSRSKRVRAAKPPQLAVTVSIGAAHSRGTAGPHEVVKAADKALYRAKEGGRNRLET